MDPTTLLILAGIALWALSNQSKPQVLPAPMPIQKPHTVAIPVSVGPTPSWVGTVQNPGPPGPPPASYPTNYGYFDVHGEQWINAAGTWWKASDLARMHPL
jgi:hypothetical protein